MKMISILAVTLAALCFVSPAEAKLFDRFRNRPKPVPIAVSVEQAPETQAIEAPKGRRLNLRERIGARLKFRAALKEKRIATE